MIKLAIVSPCYNEADIIQASARELNAVLERLISSNKVSKDSSIIYVNDGSTDNTWHLISEINNENSRICGISLRNNVGHQKAIYAGMIELYKYYDAIITVDADLQDDLNLIDKMLDEFIDGAEIVYVVKDNRNVDNIFKRITAHTFYKFQTLCGIKALENHADYRLMSQDAINELCQYQEKNIYLRGMIPLLGMKSAIIKENIKERCGGVSKYTLNKMLSLGSDGITSFSVSLLNFVIYTGVIMMLR